MEAQQQVAEVFGPEARRGELASQIEAAVLTFVCALAEAGGEGGAEVPRAGAACAVAAVKILDERRSAKAASMHAGDRLASELTSLLDLPVAADARGHQPGSAGALDVAGKTCRLSGAAKRIRFRRLVSLLDSVHDLLSSGRHASQRELFYTHAALFSKQRQSDGLIKTLCRALGVPRHYLRVVGSARGLVRGHLRILEPGLAGPGGAGCWVDGMDPLEPRGHSIAPICAHLVSVESSTRTVLIVEKETVFQRLLSEGFLEHHRPCVLITARGFPDLPTRYLLRRIFVDCASPRVFCLVDYDPSGLVVAATYAFGPEDAWIQDDLSIPLLVPLVCPGGAAGAGRFGLGEGDTMPLTPRDESLLRGLRKRLLHMQSRVQPELLEPWERFATQMSKGGIKYEIDSLSGLASLVDCVMEASGA
ncbi:unnamed protein product [Prorocentrum cordatum]|uniref:DNA topoisomerase (ATP-hydrolyzing) n=1 Tax=Prorocentrum cordatum TaxID=2364126 RepID=A0ABN9PLM5_9DINO|nr:unnamed protein product [Polarella glacialis]